jgi:predicted nucleotidyltransferase
MVNIKIRNNILSNSGLLEPKEHLHKEFWANGTLDPEVSEHLMVIMRDIMESMDIKAEIKDIIITGSIASYNWHAMSDIDLHILLDFEEINEDFELVKRMLDQSRIVWNKTHDIMVKGHEVELYFQDSKEAHQSQGIWSLVNNAWVKKPEQIEVDLDLHATEKKAEAIAKAIDHVEELFQNNQMEEAHTYATKIKNKLRNLRSAGLNREGVYSPENMAFKMLRNSNYLEKLSNLKIDSYDSMMSLTEIYIKDYFSSNKDPEYLEFEGKYDPEGLLDPLQEAPWGPTEESDIDTASQQFKLAKPTILRLTTELDGATRDIVIVEHPDNTVKAYFKSSGISGGGYAGVWIPFEGWATNERVPKGQTFTDGTERQMDEVTWVNRPYGHYALMAKTYWNKPSAKPPENSIHAAASEWIQNLDNLPDDQKPKLKEIISKNGVENNMAFFGKINQQLYSMGAIDRSAAVLNVKSSGRRIQFGLDEES